MMATAIIVPLPDSPEQLHCQYLKFPHNNPHKTAQMAAFWFRDEEPNPKGQGLAQVHQQ